MKVFNNDVKRTHESLAASEISYRRLFESAKDGILILDSQTGHITNANPFIKDLLGYSSREIEGKQLWEIGLFGDQQRAHVAFHELQTNGYVRYEDLPLMTKDGQSREVEFVSNVYRANGENVIQCNIRDITDRKRGERDLAQIHEKLKFSMKKLAERNQEISMLSEMGESLHVCLVLEEAYRVVARFCQKLFPETKGGVYKLNKSQNILEVASEWGGPLLGEQEFAPNDCVGLRRGKMHAVTGSGSSFDHSCGHLGESAIDYLCVPMIAYGEVQGILHLRGRATSEKIQQNLAGTVADYIGLAIANIKLREALRSQSIHDPVTGLYNRLYMKEALDRELRRAIRNQKPLGLLIFDIDHFKKFNDTFGHAAGDSVLQTIGSFLKNQVRSGMDIPCRYGGEEFLLILPGIPLDEARKRAETLREEVKSLTVHHAGKVLPFVTFSVGIAEFPDHGPTIDDLLKAADNALYRAKAEGRDRVIVGGALGDSPLKAIYPTS
jgi:diguanylate cyclase (GGDEF)-like protein/PAS domain S-box-containing protein